MKVGICCGKSVYIYATLMALASDLSEPGRHTVQIIAIDECTDMSPQGVYVPRKGVRSGKGQRKANRKDRWR